MGTLIKTAIERPVAILALVLLTVLFGTVALRNIPIQMSRTLKSRSLRSGSIGPVRLLKMLTARSLPVWNASLRR